MTDPRRPDIAPAAAPTNEGDAPVWRRNEIDSPCVQICVIHPGARICAGCGRTPDEIARWSSFTDDERAAIKAELPARAERLRAPENRPSRRRRRLRESETDA